jgi:hypothetical protein
MPRRTYKPKAGRRRPTGANPDSLAALAYEMQRLARWRAENRTRRDTP